MSIKVSNWVWKHSQHRSTQKLLLLALADFSNDSGISWPSTKTLADRIGETDRRVRQIISELIDDGTLLRKEGGGRGKPSRYAIALGLNEKQRTKLKDVLENTVTSNTETENPVAQNTVVDFSEKQETLKSGAGNPEIFDTETLKSGADDEATFIAPQSTKTPQTRRGIRHVDPLLDPESDPIRVSARRKRTDDRVASEHQKLMTAYQQWLGYPIPNGGQEGKAARHILTKGYTVEQACQCYQHLRAQAFYEGKHISLQLVHRELGAYLQAQGSIHDFGS